MEFEGRDVGVVVVEHMLAIEHAITNVPAKTGLELVAFVRRRADAVEAQILADRYEAGASDRGVEDLLRDDGKTSKREAKKRARRGKATNANPTLATRMAQGNLSTEQVDVIADAAEQTGGDAAVDEDLIDDIAGTTPEQGKKKATTFINKRLTKAAVQSRHNRQRQQRGWFRHRLSNGNSALTFHGDDEAIDHMERCVRAQANHEYQTDGGRATPSHKHPRTADQRAFDAAHKLLTNDTPANDSNGSGASAKSTSRDESSPGTGAKRPPSRPKNRRATVFVTATVDQLTGVDDTVITMADGTSLPASVVEELACGADFIGQIFSTTGELLWQGRKKRLATPAQINGLISRDGGCVQCGAHHDRCIAHHIIPFEAPAKGETNIDGLVFVCDDCHHRLHANNQTIFYDSNTQTWKTRASTWDEIPPDNRPERANGQNTKSPPGKYSTPKSRTRRGRTTRGRPRTSGPNNLKPRLDQHRNNQKRHDPHGDRLF